MNVPSCSFSSDKKLARCEQMHYYRYTEHLKPRVKKVGLFRGDWIHQLREAHYRGGDWRKKLNELKATVWDKLFDEEREEYGPTFITDIRDLMEHYIEHWAPMEKKWKILEVEADYQLITKYGFPVIWKADLIVQEGRFVILVENKNKKDLPESNERVMSPQVHTYAYLHSKVGRKIDTILWDYIRTEAVPAPQILKDGTLSKRKINTDRRTYLKTCKEAGLAPDGDYAKSLPETLSLLRIRNSPNLRVGELFVRDWVERARRAEYIARPLRNFNRTCDWECDYKNLCMADMMKNVDREGIIKKEFIR